MFVLLKLLILFRLLYIKYVYSMKEKLFPETTNNKRTKNPLINPTLLSNSQLWYCIECFSLYWIFSLLDAINSSLWILFCLFYIPDFFEWFSKFKHIFYKLFSQCIFSFLNLKSMIALLFYNVCMNRLQFYANKGFQIYSQ